MQVIHTTPTILTPSGVRIFFYATQKSIFLHIYVYMIDWIFVKNTLGDKTLYDEFSTKGGDAVVYTEFDIRKSVVWDDSKQIPHWELSLNGYTLSCDMADNDYRATVIELLTLANNE